MESNSIGLLGLGHYVPAEVITNEHWAERLETTDEWIRSRTGIERRRFAAAGESTADLAIEAGRRALDAAGLRATDLGEIIVATDTPEAFTPDTAAYVQFGLGAGEISAYDLAGSGCAGFLQALDVARSRARDVDGPILVIGVEVLSKVIDLDRRETAVLFGDGAGAAIVGRTGDRIADLLTSTTGTDGSKASILGIHAGGTRTPFSPESAPGGRLSITMEGRKVFREAVRRMSEASSSVLRRAELPAERLALVVPHQANLRILRAVAHNLDLRAEQLFVNVQDYGNTGSASVPLALSQAYATGRIPSGGHVLLTSFGAGFHWAASLLRFT